MPARKPACKDCCSTTRRLTPPGPRCATCHRLARRARADAAHGRHVEAGFGITEAEYQKLLKAQNGVCYICRKRPGKKRLAVDHWHGCTEGHSPKIGCKKCIRGLLHSKCNSFLGWIRDDPMAMFRGFLYLLYPPARKVFNNGVSEARDTE